LGEGSWQKCVSSEQTWSGYITTRYSGYCGSPLKTLLFAAMMKRMFSIGVISLNPLTRARTAANSHFSHRSLFLSTGLTISIILITTIRGVSASATDDSKIVAALDAEYQAAVKINDAATISRILADDFVLVTGSGKIYNKADMLKDARDSRYEHNDEDVQTVRVWGDTAVVTARLWEKGATDGKPFEHRFWFSDSYVRTPAGWKYVFGQSSLPLPNTSP
jgi:ketosteroid isomerase-like protein